MSSISVRRCRIHIIDTPASSFCRLYKVDLFSDTDFDLMKIGLNTAAVDKEKVTNKGGRSSLQTADRVSMPVNFVVLFKRSECPPSRLRIDMIGQMLQARFTYGEKKHRM